MVLPRAPSDDGSPQEDPRDELVRRLLEYRKYKAVAETLHELEAPHLGVWSRPTVAVFSPDGEPEETDLSEVSLFDLLTCFRTALDRYKSAHPPALAIEHAPFSIKEKMADMLALIQHGSGPASLSEVFLGLSGRAEAIAVFLAILELLRLLVVRATQAEEFAEIYLERTPDSDFSLEGYEEAYR
jgi:segregation and condensation protein A